jgi:hypothetical protein
MNTAEAIQHLKKVKFYIHSIELIGKNLFKIKYATSVIDGEMITARELIKLAKVYSSENNQNTKIRSIIKKTDKKMNRRETKKAIKSEDFDKIPQHGKVAMEDSGLAQDL